MTTIPDTLAHLATPIDRLRPYPGNPRKGSLAHIAESLQVNGQYRPIVVRIGTNEVLAGNHTLAAAQQLGWSQIAATFVDCDDEQAARIVLVDNRTNDLAEYDDADLLAILQGLPDLDGTGYDQAFLDEVVGAATMSVRRTDPDDAPSLPEQPVTNMGDVWVLGPHRVWCGDATDAAVMERLDMADGVDLILTDPPYCSGGFQESGKSAGSVGTTSTHKQIANDRLSTRGYIALLKAALTRVPADYTYVFTDWRMWVYLFDVVESSGFGVRSMIVWDKSTPGMGRGWRSQHELVMWGAKKVPPYPKRFAADGNVIQAARTGNLLHTTQKPVDLLVKLLRNTPFVGIVYDPFGGSGSTLIAAEHAERVARVAELDPGYVDVICRRYQEHTGTIPVLEATGEPHDFIKDP